MSHSLYKIYYKIGVVYIGRTNQPLQTRLRGHFFKKPMHREIDIDAVTLIEYAELPTEADMYVYEIYEINRHKPPLNRDDKSRSELTVELPPLDFKPYDCKLMDKWKAEKAERDMVKDLRRKERIAREVEFAEQKNVMRRKWHDGEITEEAYYAFINSLEG